MKKLIILLLIVFCYVFLKSNTIEQRQWREEVSGVEYLRNSYRINWHNFTDYLQNTYKTAKEKILRPR